MSISRPHSSRICRMVVVSSGFLRRPTLNTTGLSMAGFLVGRGSSPILRVQQATVVMEDPGHPSVTGLPVRWDRVDEWYEFQEESRDAVHVVATVDESTYSLHESMGDHPIIWTVPIGEGTALYTAGGPPQKASMSPGSDNIFYSRSNG